MFNRNSFVHYFVFSIFQRIKFYGSFYTLPVFLKGFEEVWKLTGISSVDFSILASVLRFKRLVSATGHSWILDISLCFQTQFFTCKIKEAEQVELRSISAKN